VVGKISFFTSCDLILDVAVRFVPTIGRDGPNLRPEPVAHRVSATGAHARSSRDSLTHSTSTEPSLPATPCSSCRSHHLFRVRSRHRLTIVWWPASVSVVLFVGSDVSEPAWLSWGAAGFCAPRFAATLARRVRRTCSRNRFASACFPSSEEFASSRFCPFGLAAFTWFLAGLVLRVDQSQPGSEFFLPRIGFLPWPAPAFGRKPMVLR